MPNSNCTKSIRAFEGLQLPLQCQVLIEQPINLHSAHPIAEKTAVIDERIGIEPSGVRRHIRSLDPVVQVHLKSHPVDDLSYPGIATG